MVELERQKITATNTVLYILFGVEAKNNDSDYLHSFLIDCHI